MLVEKAVRFVRIPFEMPNKNTFDIPSIKKLALEEMTGSEWVDPFAKNCKLAKYRNDWSKVTTAESHLEANEFLSQFKPESMDGGILDPAYSPRQLKECYDNIGTSWDGTNSLWSQWEASIAKVIKPGGKVIKCGWNSHLIGEGFKIIRGLIVNHGSHHNDTIVTVQKKVQKSLDYMMEK